MAAGQVQNVEFTWLSQVLKSEPDYFAEQKRELLYEWSNGRVFRGDPRKVATAYPTA